MAKQNSMMPKAGATAKKEESWGRFDFLGVSTWLTILSLTILAASFVLIATKGFTYGIDFAGGIETQIKFNKDIDAGKVRQFMADQGFPNANVQSIGGQSEYLIRIDSPKGKDDEDTNNQITSIIEKLKAGLTTTFADYSPEVRRTDTVGPQVGAELRRSGALAGFYCLLLILLYVGLRFDYRFAPPAVICVIHDAVVTLGIYSLFNWEVTVQTMAAALTIIGYSLNDTIVIFDRIRENQAIYRDKSLVWIANRAINDTMSRTILTFCTTFTTVVAMYYFADGAIQDFALTMMIGMILGVYSTVFVATPIVIWIDRVQKHRKQQLQAA